MVLELSWILIQFELIVSQVSAEVSRRLLSMTVDGFSPTSVSIKGNQLDVENRLYLGGLPHTLTGRRINVGQFPILYFSHRTQILIQLFFCFLILFLLHKLLTVNCY